MTDTNRKIEYVLANPEGNRTILVITGVDREDYQPVAQELLKECPEAEQVGFIKEPIPYEGQTMPFMEMCGLEFCENATRAFAYYEYKITDPPKEEIRVRVSGIDYPLTAWIDHHKEMVKLQMPIPVGMKPVTIPVETGSEKKEISGKLVEMEGIAHLILTDVEPSGEIFEKIRDYVYENIEDYPAFGVMFIDVASDLMTPVVYVRDVNTVYFEGSCASGTLAASYAMTATCCVPVRTHVFRQPAGTLSVDVKVEGGRISEMLLYGGVEMSEVKTMSVK